MDIRKVESLMPDVVDQINEIDNTLLEKFPIDVYIDLLNKTKKYTPYKNFNPDLIPIQKEISTIGGELALGLYHKLMFMTLMKSAITKIDNGYMPERLSPVYEKYFDRLISRFPAETPVATSGFYQFSNDQFVKNIGICRFSLILSGPVLLDVGFFPLKYLLRNGIIPFLKGLSIVIRYRALAPVVKMHTYITNPVVMMNFNENGWVNFYKAVAELMLEDRNYKGIYCAGWFFDPALKEISPEMAYMNRLVQETKGEMFYLCTNQKIVKDATFMNRNRKSAYEEGRYKPSRFVIFVPRKKLLSWYNDQHN